MVVVSAAFVVARRFAEATFLVLRMAAILLIFSMPVKDVNESFPVSDVVVRPVVMACEAVVARVVVATRVVAALSAAT